MTSLYILHYNVVLSGHVDEVGGGSFVCEWLWIMKNSHIDSDTASFYFSAT